MTTWTDTPHLYVAQFMRNDIIRLVLPVAFYLSIPEIPTFVAFTFQVAFTLLKRILKMLNCSQAPFPFLDLPQELRDMVYENLLEDPHYPPPRPCPENRGPSWLRSMPQTAPKEGTNTTHKSNFLFLANKQIYTEYMELVCKKTTFHLTVGPHNYAPPTTPAEEEQDIWEIPPQILKQMKRCDINLVTTCAMVGVSDPRNMKPEDWALARQMRRQLAKVQDISELNLHVKVIGDPLWYPLWVWYLATQALWTMGSEKDEGHASDGCSGPKFNRVSFSLDIWSPGENYLMRDPATNQWAWWCLKGHCAGQIGPELTVQQFATWLYKCPTCDPEE